MSAVLMIPGTDCPADTTTPAGRNYLAALLAACAAGKSGDEARADALAAYRRTLSRAPIAQRFALKARAERHARFERMVECAFYVAPTFHDGRGDRRPREQRHGTRCRVTRGSPDDADPEPFPPPVPQPAAEVGAPRASKVTITVTVESPRPRWEDMPECPTCDSTAWQSLPDELNDTGHVYSSVRPCPDCDRIGSRAAA